MLKTEMVSQGNWLFARRSYAPAPLFGAALLVYIVAPGLVSGPSPGWAAAYQLICLAIALLGAAIRIHVRGIVPSGTSGRNTQGQVATVLNTDGFYSVVRHPLYLGNVLIYLGVVLFPGVWWLVALFVPICWLYYERIMMAEEAFLEEKFGQDYRDWSEGRPAFLPRFRHWRSPADPFRIRAVLRRERSSLMGLGVCFGAFKLADYLLGRPLGSLDWIWAGLAALTVGIYLLSKLAIRK